MGAEAVVSPSPRKRADDNDNRKEQDRGVGEEAAEQDDDVVASVEGGVDTSSGSGSGLEGEASVSFSAASTSASAQQQQPMSLVRARTPPHLRRVQVWKSRMVTPQQALLLAKRPHNNHNNDNNKEITTNNKASSNNKPASTTNQSDPPHSPDHRQLINNLSLTPTTHSPPPTSPPTTTTTTTTASRRPQSSHFEVNPLSDADGCVRGLYYWLWKRSSGGSGDEDGGGGGGGSGGSCPGLMLPDTVVYKYRQPLLWVFTSNKDGQVRRKKKYNLVNSQIFETMKRPKAGRSDICAAHTYPNESSKTVVEYFDAPALKSWLLSRMRTEPNQADHAQDGSHEEDDEDGSHSGVLQRFVVGKCERNSVIRATWSPQVCMLERRTNRTPLNLPANNPANTNNVAVAHSLPSSSPNSMSSGINLNKPNKPNSIDNKNSNENDSSNLTKRVATFESGDAHSVATPLLGSLLAKQVQILCNNIVDHVFASSRGRYHIARMVAYFKVDRKNRLWFLHSSSLRMAHNTPRNGGNALLAGPSKPLNLDPQFQIKRSRRGVHRMRCPGCGTSDALDQRYPITFKAIIAHWQVNNHTHHDRPGEVVPPVLKQCTPRLDEARYSVLCNDPAFLYRTAEVCEACCLAHNASAEAQLERSNPGAMADLVGGRFQSGLSTNLQTALLLAEPEKVPAVAPHKDIHPRPSRVLWATSSALDYTPYLQNSFQARPAKSQTRQTALKPNQDEDTEKPGTSDSSDGADIASGHEDNTNNNNNNTHEDHAVVRMPAPSQWREKMKERSAKRKQQQQMEEKKPAFTSSETFASARQLYTQRHLHLVHSHMHQLARAAERREVRSEKSSPRQRVQAADATHKPYPKSKDSVARREQQQHESDDDNDSGDDNDNNEDVFTAPLSPVSDAELPTELNSLLKTAWKAERQLQQGGTS